MASTEIISAAVPLQSQWTGRGPPPLVLLVVTLLSLWQGENVLVLRRKYRQMLVERSGGPRETPGGGGGPPGSPARTPATARWEAPAQDAYSPVPAKRPLQEISAEQVPLEGEDTGSGSGRATSPRGPEFGALSECADLPSSLEVRVTDQCGSVFGIHVCSDPCLTVCCLIALLY